MAHKSHRQKALQSQLESQPAVSLVPSVPHPTASTSSASASMDIDSDSEDLLISTVPPASISTSTQTPTKAAVAPQPTTVSSSGFASLPASAQSSVLKNEFRRIPIPSHRMSPLKREWVNLYTPMVEMLGLQVRMNVKRRCVEMKVGLGLFHL
jgi:RNA-binding protein PNO1